MANKMAKTRLRHTVPIKSPRHYKYSIIIPAAGLGYRMKSYGPKSLFNLLPNVKLINYQLALIKQVFINYEIILITGFKSKIVMNTVPLDIISIENESYLSTNVARSIGIGLRAATTDKVIILYGDLFFNKAALSLPFQSQSTVVICDTMNQREVGCTINNDYIIHMDFHLKNKWGQIAFFTGKELKLLQKLCWNNEYAKYYGFQLINTIIQQGGKLHAAIPKNAVTYDIDTVKDINVILTKYGTQI